jgi:hypothetical protein
MMHVDPTAEPVPTAQTLHDAFVAGTLTEIDYDRALGEVKPAATFPTPGAYVQRR